MTDIKEHAKSEDLMFLHELAAEAKKLREQSGQKESKKDVKS